jgi:hypothetical protein
VPERESSTERERAERFAALEESWKALAGLRDDDATVERNVTEAVTSARAKRRKG